MPRSAHGRVGIPLDRADIARADLLQPGSTTAWRFTLRDGRSFDGALNGDGARLVIAGKDGEGANVVLSSFPRRPQRQPFIGVIFEKPAAAGQRGPPDSTPTPATADAIMLRNGDRLVGTVATPSFALQTASANLRFATSDFATLAFEWSRDHEDELVTRTGEVFSGALEMWVVEARLPSGTDARLDAGGVAAIRFHAK